MSDKLVWMCLDCLHRWYPRGPGDPRRCPDCRGRDVEMEIVYNDRMRRQASSRPWGCGEGGFARLLDAEKRIKQESQQKN